MRNAFRKLLVSTLVAAITAFPLNTAAFAATGPGQNPPGSPTAPTFSGINVMGTALTQVFKILNDLCLGSDNSTCASLNANKILGVDASGKLSWKTDAVGTPEASHWDYLGGLTAITAPLVTKGDVSKVEINGGDQDYVLKVTNNMHGSFGGGLSVVSSDNTASTDALKYIIYAGLDKVAGASASKPLFNVTGDGDIGIGLGIPTITLDVRSRASTFLQSALQALFSADNAVPVARFAAGQGFGNTVGASILLGNDVTSHVKIRSSGDGLLGGKFAIDLKDPDLNPFTGIWTNVLTLLRNGNVGINEATNPVAKLHVNNSDVDNNYSGYSNGLVFGQTGGWLQAGIWPYGVAGYSGGLVFGTDNDGIKNNNVTKKMILTPSGDLTLGTPFDGTQQYLKIDVKNGIVPPSGDCTAGDNDEVGRTLLYSNSTTYKLYVCTHAGWKTATLQ